MIEKYFEINTPGVNIRCKAYSKEKSTVEKAVVCCTGFAGHKDNLATRRFAEKLLSKHKDVILLMDVPQSQRILHIRRCRVSGDLLPHDPLYD